MKPNKIILIRHGQSVGNVNRNEYCTTPDFAIKLTELGIEQARDTGGNLNDIEGDFKFYISPYHRTRQTFENIQNVLNALSSFKEDPRLREQEWNNGAIQTNLDDNENLEKARDSVGTFYYRFPNGESCSDVYNRMSNFIDNLNRDFEKIDFPQNCVIVSHGMAIRVFLMCWFNLTVEEFEVLRNPENCCQIILELQSDGKYKLKEKLQKYEKPTHPYHFPLK